MPPVEPAPGQKEEYFSTPVQPMNPYKQPKLAKEFRPPKPVIAKSPKMGKKGMYYGQPGEYQYPMQQYEQYGRGGEIQSRMPMYGMGGEVRPQT